MNARLWWAQIWCQAWFAHLLRRLKRQHRDKIRTVTKYVEPLREAKTSLADFFSILLM